MIKKWLKERKQFIIAAVVFSLFGTGVTFALPYFPSDAELDPTCAPGDVDCHVEILPALTAGSAIFSNGTTLAQDNANFFWDDSANQLLAKYLKSDSTEYQNSSFMKAADQTANSNLSIFIGRGFGSGGAAQTATSTPSSGISDYGGIAIGQNLMSTTTTATAFTGAVMIGSNIFTTAQTDGSLNIALGTGIGGTSQQNQGVYIGGGILGSSTATSGYNDSFGHQNVAIGRNALNRTNGGRNTAVGTLALAKLLNGYRNTAIGKGAGNGSSTSVGAGLSATYTTFLGADTDFSLDNITNSTAVGYGVTLDQSNTVILGNGANVGIGDTTPNALLTVGSGDLFQVDSSANTSLFGGADLRFIETGGGTDYVGFQAPAAVTTSLVWTLPGADSSGCLQSNGSGTISISSCGGGSGSISGLTVATGTNTIDNTDYAQTWNWSTADTENPLTINANALTSGKGLTIASSSTGLTGNVANFTLSGSNAANTGAVVQIDNTGTSNTNTGLVINHYATGSGNLALRINDVSGDTSPFVIDGVGSVGIGTDNPRAQLEIDGTTLGSYGQIFVDDSSGTTDVFIKTNAAAANSNGIGFMNNGVNGWELYRPGGTSDLRINDGSSDLITFKNGGGIGIGMAPTGTYPLEVLGQLWVTKPTGNNFVNINTGDNSEAGVKFLDNGSTSWELIKEGSSSDFGIWSGSGHVLAINQAGDVTIGNVDTTGSLFILDTKTGAGDPSGVNGGMYYNSNSNKFRCYENTSWVNCIGGSPALSSLTAAGAINTIDNLNFAQTWDWSTADNENGLTMNANALTSGKLLTLASSSTAFTGNLANFTLSGSNAANTGAVVQIDNTGTSNTNTALLINHYATGTNNIAFQVNDVSGDTTPFAIDGAGFVGIGTSAPLTELDVRGAISADANSGAAIYLSNSGVDLGEIGLNTANDITLNSLAVRDSGIIYFSAGSFGGQNTFPALKRNGTGIDFRLADDSAYTGITAESINIISSATTGTGSSIVANSLTTGIGLSLASSSLSSGTLLDLSVTGTAPAGNTQKALNVSVSGTNATASQTTYGGYFSNTRTSATSINIGAYFTADNGLDNWGILMDADIAANVSPFVIRSVTGGGTNGEVNISSSTTSIGYNTEVWISGGNAIDTTITTSNDGTNIIIDPRTTGRVGINDVTPDYRLDVDEDAASAYAAGFFNDGNNANRFGIIISSGEDSGSGTLVQFNDGDGTDVGEITFSGTTTTYGTSSDLRMKDNIVDTHFTLQDLMNIKVHDFTFKAENTGRLYSGFIAQEIINIYPDAVFAPDDGRMWSVDYGKITPLIIKAIQDLKIGYDLNFELLSNMDTSVANSFGNKVKDILANAQNGVIDLYAKNINSDRIKTKELCVGDVCVNEAQFLQMVQFTGVNNPPQNNQSPNENPEPAPEPDPTPDSDTPDPEPTVDPEPAPEPSPEIPIENNP